MNPHKWLVWSNEHKAWWRKARCGYTTISTHAGRYTFEEASSICREANRFADGIPNETMIPEDCFSQTVIKLGAI